MNYLDERNRNKLVAALRAGLLAVVGDTFTGEGILLGQRYSVDSASNPSDPYTTEVVWFWAGGMELRCSCDTAGELPLSGSASSGYRWGSELAEARRCGQRAWSFWDRANRDARQAAGADCGAWRRSRYSAPQRQPSVARLDCGVSVASGPLNEGSPAVSL